VPSAALHQCVEDEGVDPAVPGHIDEADQVPGGVGGVGGVGGAGGADPTQAVSFDLTPPVDVEQRVRETLRVEGIDLGVGERCPPLVVHVHRR
jgi:hypothetical protein